jgi:hypothetical protein
MVVLCRLSRGHEKLWGKALSMMTRVAAFTMPVTVVQPLWRPQQEVESHVAEEYGGVWCLRRFVC